MVVQAVHAPDENTMAPEGVAVDTDQLCEPDVTGTTDICHIGSGRMFHVNSEENLKQDIVEDNVSDIQCEPKFAEQAIEAETVNSINHCGEHLCKDDTVERESGEHGAVLQCNSQLEKRTAQTESGASISPHETSDRVTCSTTKQASDELKDNEEGLELDGSSEAQLEEEATDQYGPVNKHVEDHQGSDEVSRRMLQSSSEDEQEVGLETARFSKKSAKKAQEELQEIYSEGQRMVRESPLSLPYHNPPRLSFKEFLAMRRGKCDMLPEPSLTLLRSSNGGAVEKKATSDEEESTSVLLKERFVTSDLLSVTPQLSSEPLVISASPGMCDLMERFTKHATSREKKDRCAEQPSEQSASSTPVQKRRSLKQQLLQQMMEKREKVLEERLRQHKVYEEEVEEEEEALSNSESEESAVDDEDRDVGGEEGSIVEEEDEEEILSFRKRPKRYNPFIEDEAEDAEGYETGGKEEEEEEEDEGKESGREDNEREENFLGDKEHEGEKRSLWDSTLDDLDVFSPISGLTNVRYLGQQNKDSASCTSSPEKSLTSRSPLHRPELSLDKGASGARVSKALWMSSQQASTQQEMDELIGLCSGSFDARASVNPDASKLEELEDDNDEEHEDDSESADERGDEDSDIDGGPIAPSDPKHGFRAEDFFEDEAELSGSDIASDDEEDADEEQLLADLLATDTQPLDEEGIREEVGRLHFKHLLDQDKRELKIYQEMLLEDGDLHSEGGGRQRKFRWKRADAAFVDGPRESDSEGEEAGGTEEDVAWRLQRFEREQWLRDQEHKEHKESPKKTHTNKLRVVTSVRRQEKERTQKVICGSFLRMGNDALTRIAERLKDNRQVDNTGALTTKNFVFRSLDKTKELKRPPSMPLIAPSCKKVKVSPLQSSSIFTHL